MRMKLLVMTLLLVVMTTFADSAFAALLGVQPGLPQISFNIGSTSPATSYDPATGLFSVTASPLSYRWSALPPVAISGAKSLTLRVHLDSTGRLIPNVEGDGVVVTGTITAAGQTYSGTLLTGKVTAFGFFNSTTTTDSFDFRLTTTGGTLLPQWEGKDIGITLASESSNFNGNFAVAFRGNAKGTIGTIPGPYMTLAETCTDAVGLEPIQVSALLTNTGTETLKNITCTGTPEASLTGVPAELAAGASATVNGSYQPAASPSTGQMTCTGTGNGSQVTITRSSGATCSVVTTPALSVSATCADAPAPGAAISVSATVSNTGNETLTGLTCYDSAGSTLTEVPATLAPGATAVVTGSYLPTTSGSADVVTCSARGAFDGTAVSATSATVCNILTSPALAVTETCSDAPAPGQPIALSAVLTNSGNEPLIGITCSDSNGAAITGVPATLAPGATAALTASYIPGASGSTDTITCSASGAINSGAVSAVASASCNILTRPGIAVAQTCTDAPAPGQPIALSAVLTNSGNEPLIGITCSDSNGAAITGVPATLAPGATAPLTASYIPGASASTDTITCSASGAINSGAVSAAASSTCNIVTNPALSVALTCANAPAPGLPITLSGVVTNSGNEGLTAITCSDSKGATLNGIPLTLAPGASAGFTGSYTPAASPSTDTITCRATGTINTAPVTGISSSTCSILNPAIDLKKLTNGVDAPTGTGPNIPFGAQVTWTYIVTNTGNVPLLDVAVTDDKLGSVTCPASTLAVGASMTCTAAGTAIAGAYENTGTATGSAGGVTVTSSYPSHYYGSTSAGCTYTQGFWKNHPDRWPVATLMLGTISYTKDELLTILQTPVAGNGLISLAHQLIAAKLNMTNGGSLTPAVQASLTGADALIGSLIVPPIGRGYLAPDLSSGMEGVLDTYNSGLAVGGPGHCDDVPALPCTGSIGNLVWKDLNGNGIQDAAEPGIPGVAVRLINTVTGATKSDTTDAGGYYMFTEICAASYSVTAETPAGLLPSPVAQGGNRELDSNGSPARITLPTDSYNDNSVDFGFYPQTCTGTVGDLVWNDLNGNGIQDSGEPGIADLAVTLGNDATGTTVATTTDASGRYRFTALCAGTYTVATAAPSGFTASPGFQGNDRTRDSNGSPARVTLATSNSTDLSVDFGYFRPQSCAGSIGDFIWNDLNSNGIQDAGEPGIAGVTATLTTLATGAIHTATSDANGHYLFTGLCAGSYRVEVQTPPAFSPSPAAAGSDAGKDSNASPAAVQLDSNSAADTTIDFGFYKTPTPGQATGCSLGYWKEHTGNWPSASRTTDDFDTVFGTSAFTKDINLLQALKLGGGGLAKLARQGTAALLNAEDTRVTGFPLSVREVKAAIRNAVITGSYEPLATQLDNYNNLGCPLN